MAITYSYPQKTPKAADLIIGTSMGSGRKKSVSANFSISDVTKLISGNWLTKEIVFDSTDLQSLSFSSPLNILPNLPTGQAYNILQLVAWWAPGTQVYNFPTSPSILARMLNYIVTGDQLNATINNPLKIGGIFGTGIQADNIGPRLAMDANYAQATQGNGKMYISISYKITELGPGIQVG